MKRLEYLLRLIPPNTHVVVDIGTDHGYLPIKAWQNKRAQLIYATDISAAALNQARLNLQRANLGNSSAIRLIQSDGLEFLSHIDQDKIDYVVISGLGSNTIRQIIAAPHPKIKRYLILSNTEMSSLRQWCLLHHFEIEYEDFFYEKNRPYWLILINSHSKNKKQLDPTQVEFGDWKKWYHNNLTYRDYLTTLYQRHLNYQAQISNPLKRKRNHDYMERIRRYLKQWN